MLGGKTESSPITGGLFVVLRRYMKPITGTEAARVEPVKSDDKVAAMMEKMEAMERRLADRELSLIAKEKEIDSKINQPFLRPMNETIREQVEQVHMDKQERMKKNLDSQPKVRIYMPLEGQEKAGTLHPVVLNGYRINVPKGVYIDLPQQVADIVKKSLEQTEAAGLAFRLDMSNSEKQKALSG